jgi:hypothetical protein
MAWFAGRAVNITASGVPAGGRTWTHAWTHPRTHAWTRSWVALWARSRDHEQVHKVTSRIRSWTRPVAALMLLAACTILPAHAQDTPPPAELSAMDAQAQADWLSQAARDGRLEALDDTQLVRLFKSVSADGLAAYVKEGVGHLDEYEFEMWRQERIKQRWADRPEHLQVRYRQSPMQIYAKWLPDGPHKGQEVIYDETLRPDQMYGHLGGLLRALSIWISLDGAMARTQSNHSLRDIGLQYVAYSFEAELAKFQAAGIHAPSQIDVEEQHGTRLVVFDWESPTGRPAFYAKRERVGIDLRHPWIRLVESFDNDGQPFEKIFYDKVVPRHFGEFAFDPKNPDYRF